MLMLQSFDHLKFRISDLKVMVKCLEFCTHWNFCNSKVFFLAVPTSVLKNVATSLDTGLGEAREVRRTRHVKQLLLEDKIKFPFTRHVTYTMSCNLC